MQPPGGSLAVSWWWNQRRGATLFITVLVVFIVYSGSLTSKAWGESSWIMTRGIRSPEPLPDAAFLRGAPSAGEASQYEPLAADQPSRQRYVPQAVKNGDIEDQGQVEHEGEKVGVVAEEDEAEATAAAAAVVAPPSEEDGHVQPVSVKVQEGKPKPNGGRPSWLADPDNPAPRKKVVVVTWTDMQNWVFWYDFDNDKRAREECSTECIFTYDRNMLDEAQGVVFHHLTHDGSFPDRKPEGQKWIWTNRESPLRCKGPTWDPNFIQRFDYSSTYELDSSIPLLYSPHLEGADYYHTGVPLLSFDEKDGYGSPGAAAVFFSHCHGDGAERRRDYVNELMQHMEVHSYGKCLHNRDEPGEVQSLPNWREKKWKILQRYKFYLGFDSVISKDYITEKIYDGLLGASLPIYFGAKSIDQIMPDPNSYLKVDDFEGPKQLADYLKTLAANETLYNAYFAWKDRPPTDQFRWVVDHSGERFTSMCIICEKLAMNETEPPPLTQLMTPVDIAREGR